MSRNQSIESAQGLVDAFLNMKRSKGLKGATLRHYTTGLDLFEDWRSKPYEELNQLDLVEYVNMLREERKLNPSSIQLRLAPVKYYLRWVLSGGIQGGQMKGPLPDCIAYVEIQKRKKTKPDILITPELLSHFLGECKTLESKVYFSLIYDTGARRSEILDLRIKDVQRDENGLCVELNGKTGWRKNYLHESIALLMPYINSMSCNPDDWLFNTTYVSTRNSADGKRSGSTVDGWMKRIRKRLIAKGHIDQSDKLRTHSFRHTKSRNLKKLKWSHDEINVWMGWAKGSNMATYYGQARAEDVANRFLVDTGRLIEDDDEQFQACPVCQSVNGAIAKFCNNCANALKPEYAATRDRQMSIKVQAELHQARQLIKQIQSSKFLTEQLGLETA
ncbi:MAG: tyrosine-type recombinase/integrase [Candidatus Poseidoniia archaeon]|nr:tyrosine-type recombinase/integrase [Candidatus Poseidoniia archaeon]